MSDELAKVVFAVSTFRGDAAVLRTLEAAFGNGVSPFAAVLVVDSMADGAFGEELLRRGWDVHYINAEANLGSAGNLHLRLTEAARTGADWCYALNHDGRLDLAAVRALVRCGRSHQRVGAVYPRRLRLNRGNSIEEPRRSFLPLPRLRQSPKGLADETVPVAWGSSNGALYSLRPVREGLHVWTDLWMGWEDLAYGWLLWKHGWSQLLCPDAVFRDPYEHRQVGFLGKRIFIHDKPAWTTYYLTRNLTLFVRRSRAGAKGWLVVLWRSLQETALIFLYRDGKLRRLAMLWRGLLDGLGGKTGMRVAPPGADALPPQLPQPPK